MHSCRFARVWPNGLAAMALLLLWPRAGEAVKPIDTVRLADGSVVRGEILRLNDDDELIVDTVFADEVAIEVEHIVAIEVSRPFTVRRLDGKKITGYLAISPERRLVIQDAPSIPASALIGPPPAEPPPEPVVQRTFVPFKDVDWIEEKPTFYRYEAEVNVGVQAARGNTDTTDLHFDARLEPSFGWDTVRFTIQYDKKRADEDTTTNRLLGALTYEHDFDRRWIGGILQTWERDRQRELALRTISAAGAGYKFFDHDPTHLKGVLAFAYVVEDFDDDTGDRQSPGWLWRLVFERDLYKDDVTFHHDHQLVESFTKPSNFLVQTTTGLEVDVFDFTLGAEVQFDWNNEPATGSKKEDSRYLLKLGYEFEGDEEDWWQ